MNRKPITINLLGTAAMSLVCSCSHSLIDETAAEAGSSATGARSQQSKPNVLMILADDLCDWVGFLQGHPQVKTPNLDRLVSQGVYFRNAYCAAPLSNPSRVALLSGISPARSGIYGNESFWDTSSEIENCVSLPQHFKSNGYKTVVAGKIYHTFPLNPTFVNVAWDDHTHEGGGYLPWPTAENCVNYRYLESDRCRYGEYIKEDNTLPDVVNANYIAQYVASAHEKPFFAALGLYRPHSPWVAPKRYYDMLPNVDDITLPDVPSDDMLDIPQYAINNFLGNTEISLNDVKSNNLDKPLIRAYLACVLFMDDMVGKVLDALDGSPNRDNTIVMFMGDNGYHHGEKNRWAKLSMWREACHVPLLIAAPRNAQEYARNGYCSSEVSLLDIYPTLIEMCGLPAAPAGQLDGVSVDKLVRIPTAKWEQPAFTFMNARERSVRLGGYSYILYNNGADEMYNLLEDENEWHNITSSPDYRVKKKQLHDIVSAISMKPQQ